MIGSFHDGLLITANDKIIYHNNKITEIFEVGKENQQTII